MTPHGASFGLTAKTRKRQILSDIIDTVTLAGLYSIEFEQRLKGCTMVELKEIQASLADAIVSTLSGLFPTVYYGTTPDHHRPVLDSADATNGSQPLDIEQYLTKVPIPR